jgi:hypothetical protein
MKFAPSMKSRVGLVGLAAALVFAHVSYAQSEVNPDFFEASPSATEIGVSALPANDGAFSVASQPAQVASVEEPAVTPTAEDVAAAEFTVLDSLIAIGIAACLTIFVIYAMLLAGLKKEKKHRSVSPNSSRGLDGTMPRAAV